MKLKHILTFFLVLELSQTCEIGCIRCSSTNQCFMCDVLEFYKFNNSKTSCEKYTKENCLVIDLEGNCVKCSRKFHYNTET